MADTKKKQYQVLCWGYCAGNPKTPCYIKYTPVGGVSEVRKVEGQTVDDMPPQYIAGMVENGFIGLVSAVGEHNEGGG